MEQMALPLEVLGYDGAQEAEGLHSVKQGVTQDEVHNHLHDLYGVFKLFSKPGQ